MMLGRWVLGFCAFVCCTAAWGSGLSAADTLEVPVPVVEEVDVRNTWYEEDEFLIEDIPAIAPLDTALQITIPGIKFKPFVPDPIRAFWLSLVIPGAGQIYNHKYWKLPIVYGGFLGCVYALSWNGQMLKDYTQAYLDIMDDDPNTKSYEKMLPLGYDITGREDRFKDIFRRKKNYYRKYRDMSIFAFAGVYLISVVDAYVDAELSCFNISRDLSIGWEPTRMNEDNKLSQRFGFRTYGVQCHLNF